ncbi:hypothetical protein A2773_01330 [Candidatus Gottesmanbacteria bacterium RIFCSPHIGHO2_01_FULL_39_10]|uniref:Uncharacterized protein n=1 Tax=Candidatus Gottesmanbacteria bacterium RIFCSPHIGHO2_01_FULL_39_10 TaxID=1798375 RepID=A0A1F5ZSC5_9BACT|nr:MAG: hypothetical protein A2773_01330 [Candidatus Gottesmanbacteria bacterium RIFCSPHIGHO2_01_FULL_39_10]
MIVRLRESKTLVLDWRNETVELDELVEKLQTNEEIKGFYILNLRVWMQYFRICKNSLRFNLLQRGLPLCRKRHSEIILLTKHFSKEEWPELYMIEKQINDIVRALIPLYNLHTKEPSV